MCASVTRSVKRLQRLHPRGTMPRMDYGTKTKTGRVRLIVEVSPAMAERIARVAEEETTEIRRTTPSDIIRVALATYLNYAVD